jgi:hypothetical protein
VKKNICKYIIIFNFFCIVDEQKNYDDIDEYLLSDDEVEIDDAMDTPSGSDKEFFNSTKKTEAAWIIHPDFKSKVKFTVKKAKKNFSNPKQKNCKESFPPKNQKWSQKGSKIAISNVLFECMHKGLENICRCRHQ